MIRAITWSRPGAPPGRAAPPAAGRGPPPPPPTTPHPPAPPTPGGGVTFPPPIPVAPPPPRAAGGPDAIIVHGRTRNARYRQAADWDTVGEVVAAVSVPVIGNGDILFPHDVAAARARSGCAAVMVGRGALIKPWIFREADGGYWDITADERVTLYRRYVAIAREHWGEDDHGRTRAREFLRWHLGFWCRYTPRFADGSFPSMQARNDASFARSPLEALLARGDDAGLDWLADRLIADDDVDPEQAPPPSESVQGELEARG